MARVLQAGVTLAHSAVLSGLCGRRRGGRAREEGAANGRPGRAFALRRPRAAAVSVMWLVLFAGIVAALTRIGNPPTTTVVYGLVWLASTTLPGVLVWRVLSRPTTPVQEVGFGSVLGVGLLLLAWLPATLVHHPLLMWCWPAGVVAAFVVVPRLRRHWRPRHDPGRSTPLRWHAAMVAVCAVAFLRVYGSWLVKEPLPPRASKIFQDVWYEVALTQRLRYGVPIGDPAAEGVRLDYHWFSNAHAAATATLSGAPAFEVVIHLWIVAMLVTSVLVTAATTERLVEGRPDDTVRPPRRWWVAPLAAFAMAALPVNLFLGEQRVPAIDNGFVVSSTSGILALTVVLCLVGPVLDLLHGATSAGTWVLVGLLLLLSAGTKPSILPVVAAGSALVVVVEWLRTRRPPWVAITLTAVPVALIPIAALVVMGSTSGSRLQLFETLSLDPAFQRAAGGSVGLPGHGGWLAPGLAAAPARVGPVAAGLLGLFVLTELPRLLGILGLADRSLRQDPGTWWCAGVVASGFAGLWVLAHPGYSQHYFWRIVVGLGLALSVANVVRLLPTSPQARSLRPELFLVGSVGLGAGLLVAVPVLGSASFVLGRLLPYGVVAVVLVVLLLVLRRTPRIRWRPARLSTTAVVTCFCFAAGLPVSTALASSNIATAFASSPETGLPSSRYVTAPEQRAAIWLERHSGPRDVVATNVFCSPTTYTPGCRHVSFWVAALTGRQPFLGAWAYTEASLSAYASQDVSYQQTRSPWPSRLRLSLDAVTAPTPEVIARLRANGVRWIYADRRATHLGPRLGRLATLRYANSEVLVYHL